MLCYRYGVQDGPAGHGWPVPKRIEALKRYHTRWNSLSWCKVCSQLLSTRCLSVTTLQGYTFRTDTGDLWEMFSSVYAQSSIGSSQICTLLVSRFHNSNGSTQHFAKPSRLLLTKTRSSGPLTPTSLFVTLRWTCSKI